MTLKEFRIEYPEYEDMSDEDVRALLSLEDEGQEPDNVVPALFDIEEAVKNLCTIVKTIEIPDHSAPVLTLLKQIKNALGSLEVAVKSIDVMVNVPPAKPAVINVPEIKFPEQKKEWVFDVKRDRNGFISEVIARA